MLTGAWCHFYVTLIDLTVFVIALGLTVIKVACILCKLLYYTN